MDFSHIDVMTPDGHELGSATDVQGELHMFTMDGEEVAHTASLGEIDQLLDPFGKEILAVDQMGNVMEHGHIVGHVQPGPTGVEMTTASGADVAHIEESPVGMSVSSPTGAAILLLHNRFGV